MVACNKPHTSFYAIMRVVSLIHGTPRLPSSQLMHVQQTCWYKPVDFRQWNIKPLMIYCYKNLIYVVRMYPALYLSGLKVWYGMEQISGPWFGGVKTHASFTDKMRIWTQFSKVTWFPVSTRRKLFLKCSKGTMSVRRSSHQIYA
jgi:hypothetical protein